ncbi:hypothetical protein GBH04_25270 [Salmonella enterica subsp. enterica]|nr:hypothetical protein [Salmonella enterica]EBR9919917.1 hypothetical protein [Salmonella enterica subsp. enterica serovar Richmond]EEA9090520.1 hypothetical protein [Salmonella enterica subsp. enterica]ECD2347527.1 hypothetical protein [Salmonella enterica subsp. enterica serovar Richmond]ECE7679413.1 hypothetical protein [Salmonella enterica subsp. enterica serovar Richmond]
MKERGITDGLTMNQLAERNAEHVTTIAALESRCAALSAKLSMINDLMGAAEQANKLAQEATEKLVQERNALAAENETLKYQEPTLAAMMSCLDAFYADEDVPERAMMAAYDILRKSVSTSDTDVFLAEIRAQGVERYAAQLKSEAELADETGWDGAAKFLISESEKVLAFAAQLRQEAAK